MKYYLVFTYLILFIYYLFNILNIIVMTEYCDTNTDEILINWTMNNSKILDFVQSVNTKNLFCNTFDEI